VLTIGGAENHTTSHLLFMINSKLTNNNRQGTHSEMEIGVPVETFIMRNWGATELIMGSRIKGFYFMNGNGIQKIYFERKINSGLLKNLLCHPNCCSQATNAGASVLNGCNKKAHDATACTEEFFSGA